MLERAGIGPLESDCAALQTALPAALAVEGGPTSFTVPPQFVQEFTLGTCLWAWFNTNPVGGTTLEYCYVGVEVNGENLDNDCVVPSDTGGFAIPSNLQLNPVVLAWVFEFSSPFLNIFPRSLIDVGGYLGCFRHAWYCH
ncbi:hypothetical protein C8R44DRAFT_723580 [Mycena epipterygia]|nr:hypothetical protein C8R44DRAFT_723580 [Mycena epipterygia]